MEEEGRGGEEGDEAEQMTFRALADPASWIPAESGVTPFWRGMVWAQNKSGPAGT